MLESPPILDGSADKSNRAKYASCMKKSALGIAISLLLSLVAVTPSSAVEFGTDATGDPTAVKVRGASGFLYSERIVITVAHIFGNN